MNGLQDRHALLRLLHQAFDDQPLPPGPHFVEDQRFLARWSLGTLQPQEQQQMLEHLANCPNCRTLLAIMLDDGALELPVEDGPAERSLPTSSAGTRVEDGSMGSEPPGHQAAAPRERRGPRENRKAWIAFVATAAGLLVAAMIWLGRSPDGRPPRAVALTELGVHLSGKTYAKPLPDQTDAQKRRLDELKAEVQTHPDNVPARLEYGCLLLQIGNIANDLAEAGWQFQAVLDRQPTNPDALHGLGVVLFRQSHPEAALPQFRRAVAGRPEDPIFQLNMAICLERLGQAREATDHFEAAARQIQDAKLQTRIREYLQARVTPAP